jgi:hypothetical protein
LTSTGADTGGDAHDTALLNRPVSTTPATSGDADAVADGDTRSGEVSLGLDDAAGWPGVASIGGGASGEPDTTECTKGTVLRAATVGDLLLELLLLLLLPP